MLKLLMIRFKINKFCSFDFAKPLSESAASGHASREGGRLRHDCAQFSDLKWPDFWQRLIDETNGRPQITNF